jgi:hypothetical protein
MAFSTGSNVTIYWNDGTSEIVEFVSYSDTYFFVKKLGKTRLVPFTSVKYISN